MKILVVDDEKHVAEAIYRLLKSENTTIIRAKNGKEGIAKLQKHQPQVIITDYKMPEMNGLEFIKATKAFYPNIPVIALTAHTDKQTSIDFLKEGAFRYIEKPFDYDELKLTITQAIIRWQLLNENKNLHKIIQLKNDNDIILGQSPAMLDFFKMMEQVAATDASVLLLGESGTGKSLIARAIHEKSDRKSNPFVEFNCASFNESLIESELFGHEKGSFTGADLQKPGRFELAHQGSIFLDEIGEFSLGMQVKLLRVLQENEFERVGGTKTIKTDVRLITATNQNLEQMVNEGRFREDLFFRLNVFPITIPPLRQRPEDIEILANHFLKTLSKKYKKEVKCFSSAAIDKMKSYPWKGNVRELRNVVSRAIIITDSNVLSEDFISTFLLKRDVDSTLQTIKKNSNTILTEDAIVKLYAKEIYKKCNYNKKETAKALNINFRTLNKRLS
ncbi:MAG: sigma-54-dependent Fis family transcriptional regulator [bacterium]|nr:sigma-54-dependent Fis family transcriptional regulator [bacterium]